MPSPYSEPTKELASRPTRRGSRARSYVAFGIAFVIVFVLTKLRVFQGEAGDPNEPSVTAKFIALLILFVMGRLVWRLIRRG